VSEIVKKLRVERFVTSGTADLLREAADRIEQLEAALRQICDGPRDADKSYAELFAEVCWEARAALRERP